MIGIIDTGICNLSSLSNALIFLNIKFISSNKADELKKCQKFILPGIGTFGEGMDRLKKNSLDEFINDQIINKKYLLGICLGMQLLMSRGFENGKHDGLDLIKGDVLKLKKDKLIRVPHIGWNEIDATNNKILILKNIKSKSNFYFIHSYAVNLNEKILSCNTTHGHNNFTSVVNKNKIFGVQFHPEKSQTNGLNVIKNFCNL